MVLPYLKGLINKEAFLYSDLVISSDYLHFLGLFLLSYTFRSNL